MIFEELYVPETAFYDRIADLVAGFNEVAANSELPLQKKITELRGIFDRFVGLALNEAKLAVNPELFDDCMLRLDYLADIIGDKPYSLSPQIISDGTLVRQDGMASIWEPLIQAREVAVEKIGKLHDGLLASEEERRLNRLHETGTGLTFRLPPAGEGSVLGDNTAERLAKDSEDGVDEVLYFPTDRQRSQRRNTP